MRGQFAGRSRLVFRDQHVIITGGSSGIGRATAHLLARRGAHLSIIARRQTLLEETQEELEVLREERDQRIQVCAADLADWQETERAIQTLTADGGYPPDILINCAGIVHPGRFAELPLECFRQTMDVDFFGTLHPVKAVVPMMMERRQGHIVTVSSVAGFVGLFGYTSYSPAKFAVRGFSDALRDEMRPYGISVSVLFPPDTDTPQLEHDRRHQPYETRCISGNNVKVRSAENVAEAMLRGIERRQSYIVPGLDTKLFFVLASGPMAFNRLVRLLRWYLVDRVVDRIEREGTRGKL